MNVFGEKVTLLTRVFSPLMFMDIQIIIVGIIIWAAFFYAGKALLGKIKSFSARKSCDADCGCVPKSKTQNLFIQIKR
jgi:hypothetical protein